MRTTIDIDAPILRELKRLQADEHKSLGRLVSDLLAEALASQRRGKGKTRRFEWISQPMGARIDLDDKDAIWTALDRERGRR